MDTKLADRSGEKDRIGACPCPRLLNIYLVGVKNAQNSLPRCPAEPIGTNRLWGEGKDPGARRRTRKPQALSPRRRRELFCAAHGRTHGSSHARGRGKNPSSPRQAKRGAPRFVPQPPSPRGEGRKHSAARKRAPRLFPSPRGEGGRGTRSGLRPPKVYCLAINPTGFGPQAGEGSVVCVAP